MITTVQPKIVTEEEYLTNPRYKHCEYVDGQVVPAWLILDDDGSLPESEETQSLGTARHSTIQFLLPLYIGFYLRDHPIGWGAAELHCLIPVRGKRQYRIPDLSVVIGEPLTQRRYLDRAPDFVIEIRSPDDKLEECYRKMGEYFEAGTKLRWLVLPEDESILVFLPGGVTQAFGLGETITGGNVLPGFELLIDKLF